MRKIFIVALVLAAGCDATRRDYTYCDNTYSDCKQGFVCNATTGMCEPDLADASDAPLPFTDGGTEDTLPGEAGQDADRDVSIVDARPIDGGPTLDGSTEASTQTEAGIIDAQPPIDTWVCSTDVECKTRSSLLPFCVGGQCVACKDSSHCSNLGGTPFCSAQNTCVSCAQASASFCASNTPSLPVCDSSSGRCAECTASTASTDCKNAAKPHCVANACVECVGNAGCTKDPAKAFCVANVCQGCNAPGASAGSGGIDGGVSVDGGAGMDGGVLPACIGAKPVCATTGAVAGQCVECENNASCTPAMPICLSNICAKCTADSQCTSPPGICMSHLAQGAGRCATEEETIYVKNATGCISSGTSTEATPFCQPQAGVNAVSATKRLVVITGGTALDPWQTPSTWTTSQQVSVIGRQQPVLLAGTKTGIQITNGNVYIRGLTVQGAEANAAQPGIVVAPGAILGLDRCFVLGNAGGLLVDDGAGFDIANSVFDNNQGSKAGPPFGGAYLGRPTSTSGPHRFWFNTVTNNQQTGVVCADNAQPLFGVLLWRNVNGAWNNCSLAIKTEIDQQGNRIVYGADSMYDNGTGSDTRDPAFVTTTSIRYRLTRNSPCRDFIASTAVTAEFPFDDIDGVLRPFPTGGNYDCGASEFHP